jgi:elongation factor P
MVIGINEIKSGFSLEIDNSVYYVTNYEHVKPGKGSAFVRVKLKNIKTGSMLERTFKSVEKITLANIEKKDLIYMFVAGDVYEFMDNETYEQIPVHRDQLGEVLNYLKENLSVTALVHKGEIITLEPPIFVELKVSKTEPGIRGDTSRSGSKPAILETGMNLSVPLFINEGDTIKIDTRTKGYTGRV